VGRKTLLGSVQFASDASCVCVQKRRVNKPTHSDDNIASAAGSRKAVSLFTYLKK